MGGRTFERKAPFATTSFKKGGWVYFRGWTYFRKITVYHIPNSNHKWWIQTNACILVHSAWPPTSADDSPWGSIVDHLVGLCGAGCGLELNDPVLWETGTSSPSPSWRTPPGNGWCTGTECNSTGKLFHSMHFNHACTGTECNITTPILILHIS